MNKGGNVLEVVDVNHRKLNKTRGLAEGIARTCGVRGEVM